MNTSPTVPATPTTMFSLLAETAAPAPAAVPGKLSKFDSTHRRYIALLALRNGVERRLDGVSEVMCLHGKVGV